jgi:hypothetical protein
MTKQFFLFLMLFLSISVVTLAQDTSAYEIQRQKVNALLTQRSAKFGQYDQSLSTRTGIFGFQTKRDIRNSNEILREIALTDNDIFDELKILMNYKDMQVEQVRTSINNSSESILNYRKTIKGLQDQNQKLADDLKKAERKSSVGYLLLTILLIITAMLAYRLKQKMKLLKLVDPGLEV